MDVFALTVRLAGKKSVVGQIFSNASAQLMRAEAFLHGRRNGMLQLNLQVNVVSGVGWSTIHKNWPRLVKAHAVDILGLEAFPPGSLNVQLDEEWTPPRDLELIIAGHNRGPCLGDDNSAGADFLRNGNYVHPDLRVVEINGVTISGFLISRSPRDFTTRF